MFFLILVASFPLILLLLLSTIKSSFRREIIASYEWLIRDEEVARELGEFVAMQSLGDSLLGRGEFEQFHLVDEQARLHWALVMSFPQALPALQKMARYNVNHAMLNLPSPVRSIAQQAVAACDQIEFRIEMREAMSEGSN